MFSGPACFWFAQKQNKKEKQNKPTAQMLLYFGQLSLQRDVKNYSDAIFFPPKEKYGSSMFTEMSPFSCCSLNRPSGHTLLLSPLFCRAFKAALCLNFKQYFNLLQNPEVWAHFQGIQVSYQYKKRGERECAREMRGRGTTCNEFHTCTAEKHFIIGGHWSFSGLEIIMQQLKQALQQDSLSQQISIICN